MAQRRLNELLREDQEPFQLKSYIADRRAQLQRQLRKRKPISGTPDFPGKFCKNACFFSFRGSLELRKSPLFFDFASPVSRSPKNAALLHIPARTTALLLEAALRVQNKSKPKTAKTRGFVLFESILKRLANRRREIEAGSKVKKVSVKDILRWESSAGRGGKLKLDGDRKSGPCSCNGSTPSSAVWSETSTSSQSEDSQEISTYCESPFRFVLRRSPSSGGRTPELLSPPASPCRNKKEGKKKYDMEISKNLEEEKEQCSPVSTLDAPFGDDEILDDNNFDIHGSFVSVQRSKQQLLHKTRRFEKPVDLDPIELEKRMLENDDESEVSANGFTKEDLYVTRRFHKEWKVPKYMKQLVLDVIFEEEKHGMVGEDESEVMRRVVKKVESWEEVESNTIDMMVEQDFRRDCDVWKRNQQQVGEFADEIELAIFGLLVEELWN